MTVFRLALMANMPASVQTLRMSAPVLFGHRRASSSNLISRSQFIVLVCIWKIWALLSRSGSPNSTCTVDKIHQALLAENLLIHSMLSIKHCSTQVDTLADKSADRTHVGVCLTLYMPSMQNAGMLMLMYKLYVHIHTRYASHCQNLPFCQDGQV